MLMASSGVAWAGGEIGFVEDYVLATDRTAALQQLIPGTEDHYYYHALHFLSTEQYEKVREILGPWAQRHGETPRVWQIRTRLALLTYNQQPQATLEHLQRRLGVGFPHQKEDLSAEPNLPVALDPALITREAYTNRANAVTQDNLDGFEDTALDWLASVELNPNHRRSLLSRLQRPDHPNLVKRIVEDLGHPGSGGFGSLGIHNQLLRTQLEELAQAKPDLLNHQAFVRAMLTRLQPTSDEDWRNEPDLLQSHLDRLARFAGRLTPVHNTLKALVLHHRLQLDLRRGKPDKGRFLEYLKLPRPVGYAARAFLESEPVKRFPCDLNSNYDGATLLAPIGNDEPLVRQYLQIFLKEAEDAKEFEPYVNDVYLRHLLAEVKITNGLGNPEQWASLLPPELYQQLKERIDLNFVPTNPARFAVDQPVVLELDVKNVPTLIVKVFEINTAGYYRENQREIDTDINLDGLVANSEQTFKYNEAPARVLRRRYEFPQLNKAGVYVIDFIGNGKSSRALIRKGRLQHVVRTAANGQVFTLFNEKREPVPEATLWLAGREYKPNDRGQILVPFSTAPGRVPIVLSLGDFSCLDFFQHEAETYGLAAGIYVDRESLLTRRKATVVVRPGLFLNNALATVRLLEEVRLTIQSTNLDGVVTTQVVQPFPLHEDRETEHEILVPPRTAQVSFTLNAVVKRKTAGGEPQPVSVTSSFSLNNIERTEKTEDLHLVRSAGGYVLELLGKMGEPKASRPVNLTFKHRDFRQPVSTTLKTDPQGRIVLGPLVDIDAVTAQGPQGPPHTWNPSRDLSTYATVLHGQVGEVLTVPFLPGPGGELTRSEVSLLELRGGVFTADRFDNLKLKEGLLSLEGLPAGDYDLLLKRVGARMMVRISAGDRRGTYLVGPTRLLETSRLAPLQIASLETANDTLRIRLANVSKLARVHVFADRIHPEYSVFDQLARVRAPGLIQFTPASVQTLYLTGRNIGDEYAYILNRAQAQKLPGNMLERPSLLLNPWAVRETQTGEQQAQGGEQFKQVGQPAPSSMEAADRAAAVTGGEAANFANLDFLANTSAVLVNLVPDDQGVVTIPLADLGPHQHIVVAAVDPLQTTVRHLALPEQDVLVVDQRLSRPLDPRKHFVQQKQFSVLKGKEPFVLDDISASRFELYDSLTKVYDLYRTLSHDPQLEEFAPLLGWPTMSAEAKRTFYSKYASHELTFFLKKKDPEFFRDVIQPYLANKRHKTFLDRWLLDEDLSEWRQPWRFGQLNIVERILLSQRIEGEAPATARHAADLYQQLPPNPDRVLQLFETAIQGSALSTAASLSAMLQDETRTLEKGAEGGRVFNRSSGALGGFGGGGGGPGGGGLGRAEAKSAAAGKPAAPPPPGAAPRGLERQLREQLAEEPQNRTDDNLARKRSELRRGGAARDALEADKKKDGRAGEEAAKAEQDQELYFGMEADLGVELEALRALYRQPEKTKEWAENNYHHLTIDRQDANLITVNAFWRDYARHPANEPFVSRNFADASRNFPEMLLALAVLDLPFESPKQEPVFDKAKMTLTPPDQAVAVHEEIREVAAREPAARVLVGQSYFRLGDRHRTVDGEQVDNYVTEEFLIHTVYGCQVVVTNPNSSRQKLNVLLQIPQGAIPVLNGRETKSVFITLEPYHTQTLEYHFYFPAAGDFDHFPVHVSRNDELVAFAAPFTCHVVEKPTKIDQKSWDYVSQFGTADEVLAFLDANNVSTLNLDRIAWRMHDKAFFETVVAKLTARHVYSHTLWSYALKHNVAGAVREFLQHADPIVNEIGGRLRSPLVTIDPVLRRSFEHLEYKPLVNARAHALGKRRQIVNDRFHEQYHRWLNQAAYDRELSTDDRLTATYYLLLQDRVAEARDMFAQVPVAQVTSRLQYDYCAAYLDFFNDEPTQARAIAQKYVAHPVDRWRNTFQTIIAQLDEAEGKDAQVVDPKDRDQQQGALAATEPSFEFQVEGGQIQLAYQNLKQVRVNYYLMDVELLFSRNPFVQQFRGQFSAIKPNQAATINLAEGQPADAKPGSGTRKIPLPEALRNRNVLVEVIGAGQTRTVAYYAHSLSVQVIENYGQVRVTRAEGGRPVSRAYVKVYAQSSDGRVKFYKDGYTDLRGRFDYASLSTDDLGGVRKFAILILSDDHGALVREATPPKQ
jgi:hypothetical protein